MTNSIPDCHYRISAKGLIKNEENKILLVQETSGLRDLPGGGLDHGETPQACITREIHEETGLEVTHISPVPCLFFSGQLPSGRKAYIIYATMVKNFNFMPSEEYINLQFFSRAEMLQEKNICTSVKLLIKHLGDE